MSFGPDGNLYASSLRGLYILTTDTAPGTLVDMKNYGSAMIGVNSVAWYNPTTAH
jgi:hypothetical protein